MNDVDQIAAVIAAHLDGPCDDPRCHLLGRRNVGPVSQHLAEEIVGLGVKNVTRYNS